MTSPVDIRPDHLEIVQGILRENLPTGVKVWVFGSRASWTTKDSSDLDLALEGESKLSNKLLGTLKDAFEDSALPSMVDVVDINRIGDSFRRIVESQRALLALDGDGTARQVRLADHLSGETATGRAALTAASIQRRESPFAQLLVEPVRNGIYKKKKFHGCGVKIVNMGELFANPRLRDVHMRRVELSELEQHRFSVQAGDLLFARRSLVAEGAGKCCFVLEINEPTAFESSIIRARPDPKKADSLFLYYYFNSPVGLHALDTIRRQVAVAGITGTDLAQLPLEVPPLPEQRAIAHVLGTLDDKIELNRRMNKTLKAMARALFKSWFVDFEPVRAKMEGRWRRGESLPGLPAERYDLFPERLVDSELGEVPEGWEVGVLNDAIELLSGGTPKTSVPGYWGGDIPWYTAKDAPNGSDVFALETERTITQSGVENSATRILAAGTTVITARGTVGRLACLGVPMAMNQTCYGIRGAHGYPDFFTYWHLRTAVDELQTRTHGTIFDTITRQTFTLVEMALAPVELTLAFEAIVEPIMAHILNNLKESRSLAAQRDVLLPGLVSGDVELEDSQNLKASRLSHV